MRTYILFIFVSIFAMLRVNGQPCRQITITDTTQQRLLYNFITESVRHSYFVNDKGVVVITRFIHEQNKRPSWLIEAVIDDRYKDNPPVEWAIFNRDVILFYDTKSSQFDVLKHEATPELLRCLDEVIGDRLYIRPPKRDRWMDVPGVNGKTRKVRANRIHTGNSNNSKIIIFEADGRITVLVPV
jgi:hypothetical protein